jgi:molecular chaperone GrpE
VVEKEKQEYLTNWQKDKADFINARKRDDEDKKDLIKFANERLIDDIIPVIQNFDMAMSNKEMWEKVDANWRTGVEYIYSHLVKTLTDNGLEEINPIGLPFDVYRDDAIEHITINDESKNNTVIEVIQKGYKLNGKIIDFPLSNKDTCQLYRGDFDKVKK